MRTGAPAGHTGYFHEVAFCGSDDELVALVAPFLAGGSEAGEPTMVALDDRSSDVVREALGDLPGVTYLPHGAQYARPALAVRRYRDLLQQHVAAGAAQVRAVGTVPHPGLGAPWGPWARYEAAIHRALADMPLWGMCVYDTRTSPGEVVADAERMHPHVATPGGAHLPNPHFADPAAVVAGRPAGPPDPVEALPPAVELVQPTPATARRSVRDASARSGLAPGTVEDLLIAVSEAVGNAWAHGLPPVVLRAWTAADRVVVTVSDRGPGPADPLVGLTPATDRSSGGLGLWIVHQLCSDVQLAADHDGFTVRLTARRTSDPAVP